MREEEIGHMQPIHDSRGGLRASYCGGREDDAEGDTLGEVFAD